MRTDTPALVRGESGTGKGARRPRAPPALRQQTRRSRQELRDASRPSSRRARCFGHVRGAFISRRRAARGLFKAADGGSVFLLDEIAELLSDRGAFCGCCRSGRSPGWRDAPGDGRRAADRGDAALLREAVAGRDFREDLMGQRSRRPDLYLLPLVVEATATSC
ncbi:MAG: sigma 54-interacting transcriptional regulator [Dehalococcoidia bacterium]|nr:sigma 54-interacting transcriptional regulator [Dehalococcoidia bacterium]